MFLLSGNPSKSNKIGFHDLNTFVAVFAMLEENQFKLMFFGLVILAVALEVVADVLFKQWALENRNFLFFAGVAVYLIGTIFWAFSLRYEFLSKAGAVFTLLNLILLVLAGVIFFKEDLTILNKIGIVLGIVSIVLIELF